MLCAPRDQLTDLQESLYWLRLVQLLLAVPLLALVGQGFVWVLARGFGGDMFAFATAAACIA